MALIGKSYTLTNFDYHSPHTRKILHKPRLVCIFAVRKIPTSPQLWSASFWSAKYPLASPQITRGLVCTLTVCCVCFDRTKTE